MPKSGLICLRISHVAGPRCHVLAREFDPKDFLEKLDNREQRHPRSKGQVDRLSIRDPSSNTIGQDFCNVAHIREISGL